MKYLKFNNGDQMPAIGLGTWKLRPHEVQQTIENALETGYRHIDCAAVYHNEEAIGENLRSAMKKQNMQREDVWITSKLWNDSHKPEDVQPALKQTLKDLQLDHLDLYLMHWPVAFKKGVDVPESADDYYSEEELPVQETWKAMEELREQGLVKHLGVSNFNSGRLQILLESGNIAPEINQVEMHPYLPQKKLKSYCEEKGILLTAYSPLGSRDRSDKMKSGDEPDLFEDGVIREIAAKYHCHPAELLIAWAVNRGVAVIPKSTNREHMLKNLQAAETDLDEADRQRLENLEKDYRFITGKFWEKQGAPFNADNLWIE